MSTESRGERVLRCDTREGCAREFTVPDSALHGAASAFAQVRVLAEAEGWQQHYPQWYEPGRLGADVADYCPAHRIDGLAREVHEANAWELPPTQALILEVLGARYRCGDRTWPFPSKYRRPLRELEGLRLIGFQRGFEPRTLTAWLTAAGKPYVLAPGHKVPAASLIEESCRLWSEGASPADHRVDSWTTRAKGFLRVFLDGGA